MAHILAINGKETRYMVYAIRVNCNLGLLFTAPGKDRQNKRS